MQEQLPLPTEQRLLLLQNHMCTRQEYFSKANRERPGWEPVSAEPRQLRRHRVLWQVRRWLCRMGA